MKGGYSNILSGRPLYLTLAALIFTTIFFWAWEKNPFATTLLSAQEWYSTPSTEFLAETPNDSSNAIKTDGTIIHNVSNLVTTEKTSNEINSGAALIGPSFTPEMQNSESNITSSSKSKVCNYAKGRWVADSRRPLYSGSRCKQWLSSMWACRLTQRTDFSYERYRWQPESCKMQEFEKPAFLRRMKDKTIAFIGDSLGRQQFQSLMCMATGGKDSPEVENVGKEYGLVKARRAIRPDGWAYRFPTTNTTILYYWGKLNQNRWVMYVDGKPNQDKKLAKIANAKNFTVYSIVRWVDLQLRSHPHLKAFFRTLSPRHFFNGNWNTGGSCDNTSPLSGGSEILQDGSSDTAVEGAVKGTKVQILDITALSKLRDEAHISRYSIRGDPGVNDCLHWCLPGVPDTWNEILVAQI